MGLVIPAFCCGSTQKKCYTSGICCLQGTENEYWSQTCYDFTTWVVPESMMFTLGTKTSIVLFIKNTGAYPDNYTVNYEKKTNDPNIIVDMSIIPRPTKNVDPGPPIEPLYPMITVLSTHTSGDVVFMVNSNQEPSLQRNATLHIAESDYPLSLPEFGVFGLIEIIILVVIICLVSRML